MASNWIKTGNDSPRLQSLARQYVQALITAWELGPVLVNTLAQMLGGGADYTTIESVFNLDAGKGQTFKDLIGSANTDVRASSNVDALVQKLT